MPIKKHLVEVYKNYNVYAVSGMKPTLFVAEKEDPSKGSTLVNENIDCLKKDVDKMLDFASKMHISTYSGPERSEIVQNTKATTRSASGDFADIVIVIAYDYDLDSLAKMIENRPIRRSKKHRKSPLSSSALLKILQRSKRR